MADSANVKMTILWEDEIRAAAKAFAEARRLEDDDTATDQQRGQALRIAVNAADAALFGADDDEAALVLSRPSDIFRNMKPNQANKP